MRARYLLYIILFFLFALPVQAAEEIDLFEVDIEVHQDGSFVVTENITYDFQSAERHGIFRDIPTTHPQPSSSFLTSRYTELELLEVLMDDEPIEHVTDEQPDYLLIRIGDPDSTVTDVHRYTIKYRVLGGLSYHDNDVAEVYWNATGNDWDLRILTTRVTVRSAEGLLIDQQTCFTGGEGEIKSCTITSLTDGSVTFASGILFPREGVTVAQAIDILKVERQVLERFRVVTLLLIFLGVWILMLIYWLYGYKTEHKDHRPVIAHYEPYQDFKPMLAGYLRDGSLHPQDITAGIVYLAEQGFIKIKSTKEKVLFFSVGDHEVELAKPVSETTREFDSWLLGLMFNTSDPVGTKVSLNKLSRDRLRATQNRRAIENIKKKAEKDLVAEGYYEAQSTGAVSRSVIILVLSVGGFFYGLFSEQVAIAVLALYPLFFAAILLFGYRRSTKKGYEARNHLDGFAEYLSVTGEDRFEFHNAPDKNPTEFLKHLPYAIAFGVEREWAEVFKDVTIPNPDWYDGGTTTSFSAASIASGLGTFSDSFSRSSGSSSSSASSGGGFSGGGGGGGGGGSW